MLLESCVNSALSAIEAQRGGADRVELCENMAEGGCTPSYGTVAFAREKLDLDLFVMIRPRGGDFVYSDEEFAIMKKDILRVKEMGVDGVVFGILNRDGTVDTDRTGMLADLARPMKVTFHRAFDLTADPSQAMEDLIDLGVDRILTSGQKENALSGAALIRSLTGSANRRIIIMPGGGIKEHNLAEVLAATGAGEVHMYLTKTVASNMSFSRQGITLGKNETPENGKILVDAERIRIAREIMNARERAGSD
jgi:copper homeostasis protein